MRMGYICGDGDVREIEEKNNTFYQFIHIMAKIIFNQLQKMSQIYRRKTLLI